MEFHDTTEKESNKIKMAGLKAARKELKILLNDKVKMPTMVLATIKAFRAVNEATDREIKKLEVKKGKNVAFLVEEFSIVASAIYALEKDSIDDVNPYCIGGARVEAVIRGGIVMLGIYMMFDGFDDDYDSIFGVFMHEEAEILAKAFKDQRKRKTNHE